MPLENWPTREENDRARHVYFIEAVGLDLIKIGFARDVWRRLADLQAASPVELRMLGVICEAGVTLERKIHSQLAEYRVRGEWFRRCDQIAEYLRQTVTPGQYEAAMRARYTTLTANEQAALEKARAFYRRRRVAMMRRESAKTRAAKRAA